MARKTARAGLPQRCTVTLGLDEADDLATLQDKVARQIRVPASSLPQLYVQRRSIDARRGHVRFQVLVALGESAIEPSPPRDPMEVSGPHRVVIVGDGPGGLFCAYELARAGVACTVVDRGSQVRPRRRDLKALNIRGEVNPQSNYCFGEGGAGTYSDGKLYTRSHKRGNVRDVLEILAEHGAPPEILVDARPHIGTNRLPQVITALREHLESVGVRFLFDARVIDLLVDGVGDVASLRGVRLHDGRELEAPYVVLATGHSARDVYEMLAARGVALEAKGFALGVRIEHPQALIDEIQYGRAAGHPKLPAAYYRLVSHQDDRGVYSFCMCPGGFIVPAATEADGLVLNGMSPSRRNSKYANSGLVVSVELPDLARAGYHGVMAGIDFQRGVERLALQAGGGALRSPASRVTDFIAGRVSADLPETSYVPGMVPADVRDVLDGAGVRVSERLRQALVDFGGRLRGYVTEEAVIAAVESRTSSPVRIPRDPQTLQSPSLAGLYPCGEGAGYAGGIVSAAVDGMAIARRIATVGDA